jgi:23S rRNA (cytidine1920-2'-O)/16S rRNA (cytidine1409-2'-O)-methyltransferase
VVAVDVGRHQLHERLRADPRVESREQTDIRGVTPDSIGGPVDVVVADLSFISVRAVAGALVALVRPGGDLVVLVKPQFEAGRAEVSRGKGVVRDPEVWHRTLDGAVVALQQAGAAIMGAMVSPLRGTDGNAEFLLHATRPAVAAGGDGAPGIELDLDALVAAAAGGR